MLEEQAATGASAVVVGTARPISDLAPVLEVTAETAVSLGCMARMEPVATEPILPLNSAPEVRAEPAGTAGQRLKDETVAAEVTGAPAEERRTPSDRAMAPVTAGSAEPAERVEMAATGSTV